MAAAPMIWARMRPANEIHAERTLSFFFFLFFAAASASDEAAPGGPAFFAGGGDPGGVPGWSVSIPIGPRPVSGAREEVLISIVRVTAGIAAHGSSNQSCPGAVPVKDRAPCRAGC